MVHITNDWEQRNHASVLMQWCMHNGDAKKSNTRGTCRCVVYDVLVCISTSHDYRTENNFDPNLHEA